LGYRCGKSTVCVNKSGTILNLNISEAIGPESFNFNMHTCYLLAQNEAYI